jgi:hypothetical protein
MKMDENLAAVHSYLCADGYVIKNPQTQKQKYYRIGLRGTNLTLLKDFQNRFFNYFKVLPHLSEGERCALGSKEIYEQLTKEFGSFYSWEWRMPKLDKNLVKIWLRAYFDCEGWVYCKSHQNRHIGADCVNQIGLDQVEQALNKLGIATTRKFNKKRNIHRLVIYGKENIILFKDKIGFLHPEKAIKLNKSIEDFMVYKWTFPENNQKIAEFLRQLFIDRARIRKAGYVYFISKERSNLKRLQDLLKKKYKIYSLFYQHINGIGTIYYELDINRKSEVKKLIDLKLIPNIFKPNKT